MIGCIYTATTLRLDESNSSTEQGDSDIKRGHTDNFQASFAINYAVKEVKSTSYLEHN